MDSRTTQGTSSASMIILATVVFPDALPPPKPVEWKGTLQFVAVGLAILTDPHGAFPHHSHQWQRPPWTVYHVHCTMVASQLCRWCVCLCEAGVALTCTGWWCASGVSAQYPLVGEVCPKTQHCCCKEECAQPQSTVFNLFWSCQSGTGTIWAQLGRVCPRNLPLAVP